MLRNTSIATIDAPEFIQVTPHNELISECEIKVLYVGENRNHSFISKETATQMANSLPGMPIVAAYLPEKEDFGDHGHVITVEDGEVKFSCKTVPYGFVAPDAQIWFQKFADVDAFGNTVEREYLMTTGYLWTGQYPEIQKALDEGLPQSMELEESTLDGHWATNNNSGVEFFIINDANFSKLCILGSDVEPCFEGASVTSPQVSKEFSNEPEFVFTLLKMRNELNNALRNEGGSDMLVNDELEVAEEVAEETPVVEFEDAGSDGADGAATDEGSESSDDVAESDTDSDDANDSDTSDTDSADDTESVIPGADEILDEVEDEEPSEEPAEEPEEEEFIDNNGDGAPMKKVNFKKEEDEEEQEESDADESEEDEDKKPSNDHSLEEVEAEFAAVKAELEDVKSQLESANAELESLRSYKLGIENSKKEELIATYHMLSEEFRAELVENIANYSYDELEAKLALAYVKEFADLSTIDGKPQQEVVEESPITTFSLDDAVDMSFVTDTLGAALMARRNN